MCRIAGFWDFSKQSTEAHLLTMRDTLTHGGPDDAGSFWDAEHQLGLGHRRLSILDLSPAGHQPMQWEKDWIVFNGEVYNFQEMKDELLALGHQFRSEGDTEVILHAFREWGEDCVTRFRGMFSFAIWDSQEHRLLLCRDRLGVKPLYWYFKEGLFMFASELKAFHAHPAFDKSLSQEAISLYLQQGYISQPHCIYTHAHKLPGGFFLEIKADQSVRSYPYWNAEQLLDQPPLEGSEESLTKELEDILSESFQYRMVADVPVGTFLSGGIDSSLVTALLQKQASRPIKTFTIGFEHPEYNEAPHAKAIAEHLGTEHHEFFCTEKDFEALLPELPNFYDEPFGDSSGIPTYLVAKMAREHVTVSLSADGGDELFGGYTKYELTQRFHHKFQAIPQILRHAGAAALSRISPQWLERQAPKIPILKRYKNIGNKLPKLHRALYATDTTDFFHRASTYLSAKELMALHKYPYPRFTTSRTPQKKQLLSYLGWMDLLTYLEGDIMTKVDRATMQVALEGREPFLDPKIIDFALRLPDQYKIKGGQSKYLLRQILYKHVPRELIERPKQGFSIPIHDWLHGVLRETLLEIPKNSRFIEETKLNADALQQTIDDFLAHKSYLNPHFIWFIYTLYAWWKRWQA